MALPHYPQSNPGACLPACVRMVLAAFDDHRSEAGLARLLGSYDFGTPANRVTRLEKVGYQVQYGPHTLSKLQDSLAAGHYPIVFLLAEFLPWANFDGFHAVVLVEITATHAGLMDPAQPIGPGTLLLDGFLAAWEEFDRLAGIIIPA